MSAVTGISPQPLSPAQPPHTTGTQSVAFLPKKITNHDTTPAGSQTRARASQKIPEALTGIGGQTRKDSVEHTAIVEALQRVDQFTGTKQSVANVIRDILYGLGLPGTDKVTDTSAYEQYQADLRFLIKTCLDNILPPEMITSAKIMDATTKVFGEDAITFLLHSLNEHAGRISLKRDIEEARGRLNTCDDADKTDARNTLEKTLRALDEFEGSTTGINFDKLMDGGPQNLKKRIDHLRERAKNGVFRFTPAPSALIQVFTLLLPHFAQASTHLAAQTLGTSKVYATTPEQIDKRHLELFVQQTLYAIRQLPEDDRKAWFMALNTGLLGHSGMPEDNQEALAEDIKNYRIIAKYCVQKEPTPESHDDAVAAMMSLAKQGMNASSTPPENKEAGAIASPGDKTSSSHSVSTRMPLPERAFAGALTEPGTFKSEYKEVPGNGAAAASFIPTRKVINEDNLIPRDQRLQDSRHLTTITFDVLKGLADIGLRQAAFRHAQKLLTKLGHPDLNPDKVFLNTYSLAASDKKVFTGWEHTGKPVESVSLTEVVIRNFLAQDVELGPLSGMDSFEVLSTNNGSAVYRAQDVIRLLPSDFMDELEENDFLSAYETLRADFWKKHGDDYSTVLKAIIITNLENDWKAGKISEEAYQMVMNVVSPGLGHHQSYLGDYRPAVSMDMLKEGSPTNGAVRILDVYGYPSNILLFSTAGHQDGSEKIVKLDPLTQQFHEFSNKKELLKWVDDQAKDPIKRKALLRNWSEYHKSTGITYYGVKAALDGIGAEDDAWRPAGDNFKYILMKNAVMPGDLFEGIIKKVQENQISNAKMLVKSNGQVNEAIWLGDMEELAILLMPIVPVSPFLVGPLLAMDLGAQLVINAKNAIVSERKEDREQSWINLAKNIVNTLFTGFGEVDISDEIPELNPSQELSGAPADTGNVPAEVRVVNLKPENVGGAYGVEPLELVAPVNSDNIPEGVHVVNLMPENIGGAYEVDPLEPNGALANSHNIPEEVRVVGLNPEEVRGAYGVETQKLSGAPANRLTVAQELDLTDATVVEGTTANTANSGSVWIRPDGKKYFVKKPVSHLMKWDEVNGKLEMTYIGQPTPEENAFFVRREVAATKQTNLMALHEHATPESFVGTMQTIGANGETLTEYYVATEMMTDFLEIGDALVNEGLVNDFLAQLKVGEDMKDILRGKIQELRQLQKKFDELKKTDQNWYASTLPELKQEVAQMRELRTQVFDELVPQELKEQFLIYGINSEVTGELDSVNVWGQNVGLIKTASGKWQLASIDRGASYDVGFWGTSKNEGGYYTAKGQRPYLLQSTEEESFTREAAQYSSKLSKVGQASGSPYPEDVRPILGAAKDERVLNQALKKIAYQILILEGKGGEDSAFNKIFNIFSEPSTPRLIESRFMKTNDVMAIDLARREALIEQAGGKATVSRWAMGNPQLARQIRELALTKRAELGLTG